MLYLAVKALLVFCIYTLVTNNLICSESSRQRTCMVLWINSPSEWSVWSAPLFTRQSVVFWSSEMSLLSTNWSTTISSSTREWLVFSMTEFKTGLADFSVSLFSIVSFSVCWMSLLILLLSLVIFGFGLEFKSLDLLFLFVFWNCFNWK